MALRLGELQVDIGADTSDLNRANKEVKRTAGSMEKSFSRVGAAIAAALSFQVIKNTVMIADRMNQLDARIRNVTKSAKDFRIVRKGIRDIAKETGASIQSVGTLAQQLLISGESIGATSDQIVQMTSNLNKLGAIGGSSAEQMGNAMLQFGQAMAGGVVRAEEFNSIVENTPLIAKAIADGMGVSVGELRKMVIDGKLLSEDVFKTLEGQTESINKKFADMPLTVERASGMIQNSFAVAVQEIDNGLGITEDIAESMKEISEIIEEDLVPGIDNMVLGIKEFLINLEGSTGEAKELVEDTFDLARSWGLVKDGVGFVFKSIKELPVNLKGIVAIIVGEVSQAFIKLSSIIDIVWLNISNGFKDAMFSAINKVKAGFFDFIGSVQRDFQRLFEFVGLDNVAESFENAANQSKEVSANLTAFNEEQLLIRQDQLLREVLAVQELETIKLEASQSAIDAGLNETENLKKQTEERIKQLKKEMKERRNAQAAEGKANAKKVINDKDTKDKLNFNLDDAQKTASSLEQAGIADGKTAAAAQIGISAAKAISKTSELGFPQALPFIAQALATIATARNALKGGGRQAGGNVSQGVMHPVNENGQPELLVQGSKQFLLSGQSGGQIIPATSMAMGGGGGMNVTVNNNAPDLVEVGEPFVTQGELQISIGRAVNQAVDQVNSSLASGRGDSAESVRQGFNLTRNI